jgi:hypothetical protein
MSPGRQKGDSCGRKNPTTLTETYDEVWLAAYADRCARRRSSIWSMTCYSCRGQEHMLTIEVDPGTRTIVQAKGKRDSHPSPEARKIMLSWARQAGLTVASLV